MKRRHIAISGTGRAGTTFLVQLFTRLGLDTGFNNTGEAISNISNAGMEWDLRNPKSPYIVKSPWICDYLDEILDSGLCEIDHIFVPVRDLFSAAESRRAVQRRGNTAAAKTSGGLWHTTNPSEQEGVLARQLYKLIYAVARHDIPLTLLYFPRLIHDAEYLYARLRAVLKLTSLEDFVRAFDEVARPELVHDFQTKDV